MSKTKTLVLAVSVLTSLAAMGLSAGSAQAQTGSDRLSIAAGDLTSALDRAEYMSETMKYSGEAFDNHLKLMLDIADGFFRSGSYEDADKLYRAVRDSFLDTIV